VKGSCIRPREFTSTDITGIAIIMVMCTATRTGDTWIATGMAITSTVRYTILGLVIGVTFTATPMDRISIAVGMAITSIAGRTTRAGTATTERPTGDTAPPLSPCWWIQVLRRRGCCPPPAAIMTLCASVAAVGRSGRGMVVRLTALLLLLVPVAPLCAQDANIIKLDGKTFRLEGIDAPEVDQNCLGEDGELYRCGRKAAEELARFVAERPIQCDDLHADTAYPKRRIGRCAVDGIDVHHWLVEHGWALNLEPHAKGRFKTDETDAQRGHFGLWKGCFVAPRDFRKWNKRSAKLLGANCPPDARDKLFPDQATMPAGCEIKGHYAFRAWPSAGIYHLPTCGSYWRTKAKRWFCLEEDALAAGFRKAYTCGWW
jgi:endonuclease YncB( thermonuclease family)